VSYIEIVQLPPFAAAASADDCLTILDSVDCMTVDCMPVDCMSVVGSVVTIRQKKNKNKI